MYKGINVAAVSDSIITNIVITIVFFLTLVFLVRIIGANDSAYNAELNDVSYIP
jgi:hypothetical protein